MRNLLLSIFLALILSALPPGAVRAGLTASPEEMEERAGVIHKSGDPSPFTGVVKDLHQSGAPRLEAVYAGGKLVTSKVWYENGQLAEEVFVSSDAWTIRRYGESGRLEEETMATFRGGRKVSEHTKLWSEQGKLKTEAGFMAGKLHGPLKEYDDAGVLIRDEIYEQGKLVKKIK
ncbi:MAG: toxin-antitoxin system YwqK family antitoxin [Thermodesulfobacteriota bacterium]